MVPSEIIVPKLAHFSHLNLATLLYKCSRLVRLPPPSESNELSPMMTRSGTVLGIELHLAHAVFFQTSKCKLILDSKLCRADFEFGAVICLVFFLVLATEERFVVKRLLDGVSCTQKCIVVFFFLSLFASSGVAFESLGVGTDALIGNDLTDLGNDGDPENDVGYDAIFAASHEPGFGSLNQDAASAGAGESAFNVFDNILGPGNDKWCCGDPIGISEDEPMWVSAQFPVAYRLTNFTVSSANDADGRDPIHWAIQGSNDGQSYTDIYVYQDDFGPWVERLEVIEFRAGDDFPVQTEAYSHFRMATFDTLNFQNGDAAYFQVGEIEFFGESDQEIPPIFVGGQSTIGSQAFSSTQTNPTLGEPQDNVPGWSAKIVTIDEHGLTLDNHTVAEEALDDFDGTTAIGAYPVVDMAGGGGTFGENLPYPNGVNDATQDDFAVRVDANVTIPAGTWSIGFGSDDGGQLTIEGLESFDEFQNNDDFEPNQIRFDGNRGHGWTVGTFSLDADLETTITASFHERGGGDSFEIAVLNEDVVEDANPANGWELLGDGTFGWSVKTTAAPLVSADLEAAVGNTLRIWQFDVNGDTNSADQFVVENPDSNVFTTILDVDGVQIEVNAEGAVASGDAFRIIDADTVIGTPTVTSTNPNQNWVFDSGFVCLDSCPPNLGGGIGDLDGNGIVDAADLDLMSEFQLANNLAGDINGDGQTDFDDRLALIKGIPTWVGDSNLDGEFNSSDFVAVFTAGKFETGEAATWAEGDWDGDQQFSSGDFVAAFTDGGFEVGPVPVTATVPEPNPILLVVAGLGTCATRIRKRIRNDA